MALQVNISQIKLDFTLQSFVQYVNSLGTGKTLTARAVANRTDATFIRVIGSELVQKYVGEGARMVRELFQMARQKKVTFSQQFFELNFLKHCLWSFLLFFFH